MNRHLLLLIAVFFPLVSWLSTLRHYLGIWIAQFRSQPSIAKRKRKNKSRPCTFPTKRPECPLCQAEKALPSAVTPEPPPISGLSLDLKQYGALVLEKRVMGAVIVGIGDPDLQARYGKMVKEVLNNYGCML